MKIKEVVHESINKGNINIYKCSDIFSKEERNCDDIYLITQFYIDSDETRKKELTYVIKKNIELGLFKAIIFLNEREYTKEEMNLTDKEFNSIKQIVIGKWYTYKDAFEYAKKYITGYIVLSNLDIFFDSSIILLRKSMISKLKSVYCLNRYDMINERESKLDGHVWSQDTWIMHSTFCIVNDNMDIKLGKPGCDNAIAYVFKKFGYIIFNQPSKIKSYHYHISNKRNYHKTRDAIQKDYLYVKPF